MRNNYTLKNDAFFKCLFGVKGNEMILKDFLEGILKCEISSVDMGVQTLLTPETINRKGGILDVKAKLEDGTKVDLEMQNVNQHNLLERAMFYYCKLYIEDLKAGKDYKELKKTIVIFILDFNYFDDIKFCHSKWITIDDKYDSKPMQMMEIHFIELPKFRKEKFDRKNKLMQWLALIDYENKEWVKMAVEENEMVREASEKYDAIFEDEKERYLADCVLKAQLARNTELRYATEEGEKRGEKLGEKRGEKRGKKLEKIETAKRLIESGAEISFVQKITNLSETEIKNLINS